jgi:parvulin-like peptidyl-prolyl isomerase
MSKPRKNLARIALLGVALLLLGDAMFSGPLNRWLRSRIAAREDLVARVDGRPITRSQLERTVHERLWLEGHSHEDATPENLASVRKAALDDLIDDQLLAIKSADVPLAPASEEVNERLRRLLGRFASKGEMQAAMKSQGIPDENALRDRLASQIRREMFIEVEIGPRSKVTDDEAVKWFQENAKGFMTPERVEVRHVFIPTLDHPAEEAKAKLEVALVDLKAGKKDFATLAKELSEDPATKENGGALGWMTRARLPVDFSAPVFSLELNQPSLVRSRLGWHLVEVTGRKPAEAQTFAQAKLEVIAALTTVKRQQAIAAARASLRKAAAAEIEIFTDHSAVSSQTAR